LCGSGPIENLGLVCCCFDFVQRRNVYHINGTRLSLLVDDNLFISDGNITFKSIPGPAMAVECRIILMCD